ncbi:phosphoenolpyruvate synthase [Aliifodinibius salicampi]|uniref:Phosphoenolpyruvate synthase n=1 Tax=Fodinibius salicampi TaxID=1920655 RepID=A0ABT3PUA5_9BACT|nr:phosphoenolpyruvate synthase [Fodinibius salicampi]MCW9711413.1 phosphoenolpyruvate synthase [Fodinibius salicampi]
MSNPLSPYILWFEEVGIDDVGLVGGKNASLGEMIKHLKPLGINVPNGFATTAEAYWAFMKENNLNAPISEEISRYQKGEISLKETGLSIRQMINKGVFPIPLAEKIRSAYSELSEKYDVKDVDVAVRSSATAEDLPNASFAGQQETYLNIRGGDELVGVCKKCFASLFTDRAISYREEKGFDHMKVALSIGVQKMVRADKASSGVIFTVDTESGFPNVVLINGSWGLGENIVQGTVNPDQFFVFKPFLNDDKKRPIIEKIKGSKELKMVYATDGENNTKNLPTSMMERHSYVLEDEEVLQLARWATDIEEHYGKPMDIEWVKEDSTNQLYIVQARPETVHSQQLDGIFKTYRLHENRAPVLVKGLSIGNSIVHGIIKHVHDITDLKDLQPDHILVTEMTEPDWVPSLKKVAGIITDFGGRTCHAAIVSRELGISAVVGTGEATKVLKEGQEVTLSSGEGEEGKIYKGMVEFDVNEVDLSNLPEPQTDIMLNMATPESAFKWWRLPVRGVGLARMEFIISQHIRIHPMALAHPERVNNEDEFAKIRKLTKGYSDLEEYFVDKLSSGIAKIAASQHPHPVIVRTSDFKTNEYADLIGGNEFEPDEQNPMLGWRGASRYYSDGYRDGFALECRALKKVRADIGLENVIIMIPFCRTLTEAKKVLKQMEAFGLRRGENGLQIYMMCEIPSNYILTEEYAELFDGFSIGSNDLTQLILGVDRDSAELAYLFDENDPAVKKAIRDVISRTHQAGLRIGFCGQAPSDDTDYAAFLVECGIDSISLNPDSVINVIKKVYQAEQKRST